MIMMKTLYNSTIFRPRLYQRYHTAKKTVKVIELVNSWRRSGEVNIKTQIVHAKSSKSGYPKR